MTSVWIGRSSQRALDPMSAQGCQTIVENGAMNRIKASLMVFGVVALAATSAPAGAATKAQVKARTLSLSNMPTGWSVDNSANSSSGGIPCLKPLKAPSRHEVKASVSYADGSLPALQEVVATGSGAAASYKALNKALAACKSFTSSSGGQKVTGSIGAMSFPSVGSHSTAYAIHISIQGVNAGVDVVLFEAGAYVGAVLYEDIGTPDASQAQAFVKEAVAKVEGKPAVTPTTF